MTNSSRTAQAWRRTALAGAGAALLVSGGFVSVAVAANSPSPGGPMMGGSAGSMMGGSSGTRHGSAMTRTQARHTARAWVADHYPGAMAGNATKAHQGYRFDITRHGTMLGRVTVNTSTGHCIWVRR